MNPKSSTQAFLFLHVLLKVAFRVEINAPKTAHYLNQVPAELDGSNDVVTVFMPL